MCYVLSVFTGLLLAFSANSQTSLCLVAKVSIIKLTDQEVITPQTKQKLSLKERLVKKILEQKLNRASAIEKEKRTVNRLGIISLASAIAAPLIMALLFGISSYALAQALFIFSLLLLATAAVTGIISLLKRKKLSDKKGVHMVPAIIGLLLGGGMLIFVLVLFMSVAIS